MQTKEMTTGQDFEAAKKPYERPELMRHGSLVDITAAGGPGNVSDGSETGQGQVVIVVR